MMTSVPEVFPSPASLRWVPWVEPLAQDDLGPEMVDAFVRPHRRGSEYFRMLVRRPDILKCRGLIDDDIFLNRDGGLPRADREFVAAVVSLVNGCPYCLSVHGRLATQHSKRADDVAALITQGPAAGFGLRWDALSVAAIALTETPASFAASHVSLLRSVGLSDDEISDLILCASFFAWANRLMLALGEAVECAA